MTSCVLGGVVVLLALQTGNAAFFCRYASGISSMNRHGYPQPACARMPRAIMHVCVWGGWGGRHPPFGPTPAAPAEPRALQGAGAPSPAGAVCEGVGWRGGRAGGHLRGAWPTATVQSDQFMAPLWATLGPVYSVTQNRRTPGALKLGGPKGDYTRKTRHETKTSQLGCAWHG